MLRFNEFEATVNKIIEDVDNLISNGKEKEALAQVELFEKCLDYVIGAKEAMDLLALVAQNNIDQRLKDELMAEIEAERKKEAEEEKLNAEKAKKEAALARSKAAAEEKERAEAEQKAKAEKETADKEAEERKRADLKKQLLAEYAKKNNKTIDIQLADTDRELLKKKVLEEENGEKPNIIGSVFKKYFIGSK